MEGIVILLTLTASAGIPALRGTARCYLCLFLHALLALSGLSWAMRMLMGGDTLVFKLVENLSGSPVVTLDYSASLGLILINGLVMALLVKLYQQLSNRAAGSAAFYRSLLLVWVHSLLTLALALQQDTDLLLA